MHLAHPFHTRSRRTTVVDGARATRLVALAHARNSIEAAIHYIMERIRDARKAKLEVEPALGGRWRLQFTVNRGGEVEHAQVEPIERSDKELEDCIATQPWSMEAFGQTIHKINDLAPEVVALANVTPEQALKHPNWCRFRIGIVRNSISGLRRRSAILTPVNHGRMSKRKFLAPFANERSVPVGVASRHLPHRSLT